MIIAWLFFFLDDAAREVSCIMLFICQKRRSGNWPSSLHVTASGKSEFWPGIMRNWDISVRTANPHILRRSTRSKLGANNDQNDAARKSSLPPFPLLKRIRNTIDSTSVTSISDNSRCMHVRRIYTARKAELCLSNINTILALEIAQCSHLKIAIYSRANRDYRLSYDLS